MPFNANRCKVQLRLAITRLKTLQQKKAAQSQPQRRDIANLLELGKDESARVRVEHIIREDLLCEAMEIIELYCELLLARFGLVEQMRGLDAGIAEAVNTLIYAAPRMSDVQELMVIRDQLMSKFGTEVAMQAMENKNDCVNSRIVNKLKVATPEAFLVTQYLKEIARAFGVNWDPVQVEAMEAQLGVNPLLDLHAQPSSVATSTPALSYPVNFNGISPASTNTVMAPVSSEQLNRPSLYSVDPLSMFPMQPTQVAPASSIADTFNQNNNSAAAPPDFDVLAKRFEALKKRT